MPPHQNPLLLAAMGLSMGLHFVLLYVEVLGVRKLIKFKLIKFKLIKIIFFFFKF